MSSLPDFVLETYLGKWEFAADHHMTASDAQSHSIGEILALAGPEALQAFLDTPLSYTEPWGAEDLIQAAAETYETLKPEDILLFAGAEEGIYAYYRTLLDKDDHAIVVTPNYQSAETIPLSICDTTGVALEANEGWTLDIDKIAAAMRPNTRSVYINFPHNPTGKLLERDRFEALVALCAKQGVYLFSDEVYRLIERDPALRLPQIADVYERGVSLNVMSKAYGLPGLRIGWTACQDRDLLDRMVRYKHYLSICNSAPSERLALIALQHKAKILDRNRRIADDGRRKVLAFLREFPGLFKAYEPDGGVVMYPRFVGEQGVEAFCTDMVENAGAVLLPASIYESALTPLPDDCFRIGYGRSNLDEGLNAMRDRIQSNAQWRA
ncbi:MAG: pyridoxal phosphate-dependent aminotransferase [Pseudomonadota bacterium]